MTWNDLMQSFVYESLDRNVKNILKHFPELSTIEQNARFVIAAHNDKCYFFAVLMVIVLQEVFLDIILLD